MHSRSSGAATPDAAALEAKTEESVALRALKAPTISSIRVTSSARPSSRANSLARIPQRTAGRPNAEGAPGSTDAQILSGKQRQHACAYEGRFSRTGGAVNEHETVRGEPIDDIVDHLLAAEEDRPLLGLEWPQAGVGRSGARCGEKVGNRRWNQAHGAAAALARDLSSQERNSPRQLPPPRSNRSISCPATSIGRLLPPERSSTAQGSGAPRAICIRSRS